MTEIRDPYGYVLAEFRERRAKLEAEIHELDVAIRVMERRASSLVGTPPPEPPFALVSSTPRLDDSSPFIHIGPPPQRAASLRPSTFDVSIDRSLRFSNISVRWAVLWELSLTPSGLKTSELTQALIDGGYKSQGSSRFGNMVSAVVSGMKERGEVEPMEDGVYRLTQGGRDAWEHIKTSPKFKAATSATAS